MLAGAAVVLIENCDLVAAGFLVRGCSRRGSAGRVNREVEGAFTSAAFRSTSGDSATGFVTLLLSLITVVDGPVKTPSPELHVTS